MKFTRAQCNRNIRQKQKIVVQFASDRVVMGNVDREVCGTVILASVSRRVSGGALLNDTRVKSEWIARLRMAPSLGLQMNHLYR